MVVNVQMYAKRSMRSLLWIAQLLRTDRCRVPGVMATRAGMCGRAVRRSRASRAGLFCRYIPFTELRSVIYNALAP